MRMARLSPVTGEPMEAREFLGVLVDVCPTTGGIWLDTGELGRLLRAGTEAVQQVDDQVAPTVEEPRTLTTRKCPVCRVPLYHYRYLQTTEVILDGCEQCGGVFVDDGELGAIASLLKDRPVDTAEEKASVGAAMADALHAEGAANRTLLDHLINTLRYRWPG